MPKIDAPTVAEHREARVRALLDAAHDLLVEGGGRPPGLAEVAERTGLSRPSVYQYFRSRDDLLEAVVEDMFPRWSRRIDAALAAASGPGERVLAYVRVNLELVADGEHAVARTLAQEAPAASFAARNRELHDQLLDPVVDALAELGAPEPAVTAELVNGLVHTGTRMLTEGTGVDDVVERITELLGPYLGLAPAPTPE
ncbi:TetR/AcrR family transcriptional regulator [Georgenia faecalis]|uniref:TetR/AcrR family transcriptional regulator n=1 Tax=Georgenia faecalis TaxID=2483799 RepID=A0ABV9DDU6_9MICO|nr:TetR/AcrR family transcriptional regulator [Georgenia faecalis]